jgi:single-strand DNA-binding protein
LRSLRGLAETLSKYLHKGSQVFIQGDMQLRTYTTRDGKQSTSLDVTVEKFNFLGAKSQDAGSPAGEDDPQSDLEEHPF